MSTFTVDIAGRTIPCHPALMISPFFDGQIFLRVLPRDPKDQVRYGWLWCPSSWVTFTDPALHRYTAATICTMLLRELVRRPMGIYDRLASDEPPFPLMGDDAIQELCALAAASLRNKGLLVMP